MRYTKEHDYVLIASDRNGRTFDFVPGRGAVNKAQFHQQLLPVLERGVLLAKDGHASCLHLASEAGITHETVNLRQSERLDDA